MEYKELTKEEIKELAIKIFRGEIFTDKQLEDMEKLSDVFPTNLMTEEQYDEMLSIPPGMLYAGIDDLRSYKDGVPHFDAFRILSVNDSNRVLDYLDKIKKAVEELPI